MRFVFFIFSCFLFISNANLSYAIDDDAFDFGEDEIESVKEIADPFEKYNRKVFKFNHAVDDRLFIPVATAYRKCVPQPVRKGVRNFITNLGRPIIIINSILQGDIDNTLSTFSSFLIDSTIGLGGVLNISSRRDIEYRRETFGRTLAVYGVPRGPYLVVPLLGSSSVRGATGTIVDGLVNPLNSSVVTNGNLLNTQERIYYNSISVVDTREGLLDIANDLYESSLDPYVVFRSIYNQMTQTNNHNNKNHNVPHVNIDL